MTTEVVVVNETNTVVTENTATNVVEVMAAGTTATVDIIAEGPAGPPGPTPMIQDEGVNVAYLDNIMNFTGAAVTVTNNPATDVITVNLDAANAGTNTNITSMTGVTGGISSPDFIQFDTSAASTPAVGRMMWNDTDGTLEFLMKGGNVTLQVGQEELLRVSNQSGSPMVLGQAIYITGSTGNHLNVTLAQASAEMTSSKTLAITAEPIANNQSGFATTSGLIGNLNTSALTEGAAIWLSATTPGGLTTTRPTQPNHSVLLGWCVRQHASVGVIYDHIANGYELDELHNVLIQSVTNGQTIKYDSATGLWKNMDVLPFINDIGDVDINDIADGDVLSYSVSTSKWRNERRISLVDGGNF
jgi:hypothetical protein